MILLVYKDFENMVPVVSFVVIIITFKLSTYDAELPTSSSHVVESFPLSSPCMTMASRVGIQESLKYDPTTQLASKFLGDLVMQTGPRPKGWSYKIRRPLTANQAECGCGMLFWIITSCFTTRKRKTKIVSTQK